MELAPVRVCGVVMLATEVGAKAESVVTGVVGVPVISPFVAFQVTKSASPESWPSAVRTMIGERIPLTLALAMPWAKI